MNGTPWTPEERALAAGMKRAGMTNKQIAKRLGRTPQAVGIRCCRQGSHRRLDGSGGYNHHGVRRIGGGPIEELL